MTESPESTVPAVRREVTVPTDVATAFAVFTARFDEVKPREHTLLAVPIERSVLEPRAGGALYDRGVDGSVCRWGEVTAFEPPHRLVFAWKITSDWSGVVEDLSRASEVEVTFTAVDAGSTRVVIEHRHLDRMGPGWTDLPAAFDGPNGWPLYLDRLQGLIAPV